MKQVLGTTVAWACLALVSTALAEVKLPALISDNMLLQANKPAAIWGSADAGEKVTVGFAGQSLAAMADAQGRWKVSLKPLAADCAVLLSALAYLGQDEPDKAEFAFQQGAQPLGYNAQVPLSLLPPEECNLEHVDAALNRLSQAVPQIKKNLLNACTQTVAADGVIQEMEAELLRAIADTLDCPIPPLIGG